MIAWQDAFHKSMMKYMTPGAYRNYANLNLTLYNERYFRENLPMLVDIKGKYDPLNLFSYSQSIPAIKILPPISTTAPSSVISLPYVVIGVVIMILHGLCALQFGVRAVITHSKNSCIVHCNGQTYSTCIFLT